MNNRRVGDRRATDPPLVFPIFDSDNTLIRMDRRKRQDRRGVAAGERAAQPAARSGLLIEVGDTSKEISSNADSVFIGRHPVCDIPVRSKYASRVHAYVEFRDDNFYLVDKSTNGTFLKTNKGEKYRLARRQIPLVGTGLISLGRAVQVNDKWLIRYRCT